MGLMDKLKGVLGNSSEKVKDLATEHGDKVVDGVAKATDYVDDKTKGKYKQHLDKVDDGAAKAVDKRKRDEG
jgi:MT0933-like antitoxin protein